MDSDKLISAVLLRRKLHQMIVRSERDQVDTQWDRGYRYALAQVVKLVDKIQPAQAMTVTASDGAVTVGELHGGMTIMRQSAKEIYNIEHVDILDT